jgi:hypothetical protein
VSDIVISTPNGLIVPFALAAGLTESKPIKSEIQTVLIGGIGATVTFPLPIFIRQLISINNNIIFRFDIII